MKFHYTATTSSGERVEDTRESKDKVTLYHELKSEGISLISAVEVQNKKSIFSKDAILFGHVKMTEKIAFARNLASMLTAGLPMARALAIEQKQTPNKFFKEILQKLGEDIRVGKTLHEALSSYPKVFSSLFVSMVAAGEESGKVADSLNIVASQMEKTYALQRKIRGALMYPSVIIIAMLGIGVFMLVYIVPSLTGTFKELNVELPASTQFIIWVSDLFKNNFIFLIVGLVVAIFLIIALIKNPQGKRMIDFVLLRFPVVGPLIKESNSARTTRTLSSLLSSGVPVTHALSIVQEVMQNSYYKEVIAKAEKQIQLGAPMSQTFIEAEKLYPVYVGEMVAVGEETGDLTGMLMKVALFYEEDVEQKTKDMSTIIEPFLMLVVGIAVGFFAISMISPMYSLVQNI